MDPREFARNFVNTLPEYMGPVERDYSKGSIIDPIMQGILLGRFDELAGFGAGLGARLAGAPEDRIRLAREREIAKRRQSYKDIRERNPLKTGVLTAAGAMVPMFAGYGLGYPFFAR